MKPEITFCWVNLDAELAVPLSGTLFLRGTEILENLDYWRVQVANGSEIGNGSLLDAGLYTSLTPAESAKICLAEWNDAQELILEAFGTPCESAVFAPSLIGSAFEDAAAEKISTFFVGRSKPTHQLLNWTVPGSIKLNELENTKHWTCILLDHQLFSADPLNEELMKTTKNKVSLNSHLHTKTGV